MRLFDRLGPAHWACLIRAAAVPDPEDPAGWPTWRMLLPHIGALASHAPPATGTETTTYLLNQAGVFPGGHGQAGPGRVSRHVQETLAARGNLAVAYEGAGGLGRALPVMPG